MRKFKRLTLTLALLITAVGGAWAQEETLLTTITPTAKEQASYSTANVATVSFSYTANGSSGYLANWGWWGYGFTATVTAAEGYTITKCIFYDDADRTATDSEAPFVVETTDEDKTPRINGIPIDGGNQWSKGIKKIEVYGYVTPASASGPEVAWDKAEKTGTFTMPGGNVTLEPEYYPQATVADGGVTPAGADARATTDDPLVKVDATKLTGAKKLMYFVSNSGTTAPAYDAEGWTDQLPTAEGLTQPGIVYVWYYPVGTDEGVDGATATYSDGDICLQSITARIAAAPTYAVTFAEGTEESDKWKADPATGVTKGETVTVTYNGTKKLLGVKVEKKAAGIPLDNTTTAWTAGTFAVPAGGLTYGDAITVSGDVTLTLTDGETLTLNKGISLASGATLTIQGNGAMVVNGTNNSTASTVAGSTGTLILTSGTLTATGGNGQDMTGSMEKGASGGAAINGSVTVNGGSLTANGGNGGNCNGKAMEDTYGGAGGAAISGDVTITDGAVAATGGNGGSIQDSRGGYFVYGGAGGAAIGGNATLTGGTLTTKQGANGTETGRLVSSSVGTGGKAVAGTVTDNR